ncbi:hypothetical protein ACSBL2_19040 [Pedobacter sp. AW31-3R]|uniref:hypothetical protein n=1 Tax=Pedobacter sp. AW31-3R TaxID=3445781 RepID=UPI003FA01168
MKNSQDTKTEQEKKDLKVGVIPLDEISGSDADTAYPENDGADVISADQQAEENKNSDAAAETD